ncbi:DnaJ domain-containing protein [Terrisporobacter petrolearius]|uniref:DnaJ domain-containing protein n=1 Tax=Terrisporobacter petrolearius TaxID=1460447 RepID=UPI001D15F3D8|nr:DnaJ domain-containing protein [Terrisporobacter petrolearius]MCC3863407.1 DnaJ domain-containing protein [Terrisporobacter petrolearius]
MTLMEDLLLKGYIDENLEENVENATADYLMRLFIYCAKADEEISQKERDYILDYFESFDMNSSEEIWLFAQYDYGRFHNYNKETIISLKNSIGKLLDKKNLDFKILSHLITLCLIDNEALNNSQTEIISDFINVFNLDANSCDQIYDKVLNEKNKKIQEDENTDDLDECYKILGLSKNCTKEDLKKQYAYLTKSYHPDKYNKEEMPAEVRKELEDTYKKINLAYDRLRDIF